MSSYSFSNQFYQHWTGAPELVRAAIVQELTDITTLLQTDTVFEEYTFSTHDLDAHLDDLYNDHHQHLLKKQLADEQDKLKAEVEHQRLEDEKSTAKLNLKQAKTTTEREKTIDLKEELINKTLNVESDKSDLSHQFDDIQTSAVSNIAEHLVIHHNSENNKANSNQNKISSPITLSLKNAQLGTDPQSLVQELEIQIDDYLTEQMLLMSENLKSWLRAEISQQLGYDVDAKAVDKQKL